MFLKSTTFLLFLSLLFIRCSENNNISTPDNYFEIDGGRYSISDAGLTDFGRDPTTSLYEGHFLVVVFITQGIRFDQDSNGDLLLKGAGALMGLVTCSNTENRLEDGTYFVNLRPPYAVRDLAVGFYTTDFDQNKVEGRYFDYEGTALLSGKMTVSHRQEVTIIQMDLLNENGKKIRSYYEGELDLLTYNYIPKIFD